MVRHDRNGRGVVVAAACFVGGVLLGLMGLVFQPPLASLWRPPS